jgi:DNA-binding MarR family transcriptional regulator
MGSHQTSRARPASDAGVNAILDSIRRVVRVLRVASRTAEKEVGLSGAQLFVLHALAKGPAQSLNEVADRTRTHQSSVSVVVQRLVERGLVARAPVPGDARRSGLSLTPAAAKLLAGSPDTPTERLVAALERIPPAARTRLAAGLKRLVTELGAADEPATMLFEDDAAPAARAPRRATAAKASGRRAGSGDTANIPPAGA